MAISKGGKGGAIVNVSSLASRTGSPNEYIDYAASKGALDTLTIGLAKEVAHDGIRVNAVRPGFIDTPTHGDLLKDRNFVRNYLKLIPLNRYGTPAEMANIIFFLASDQSAFMTGQAIVADGGQMSGQNYAKIFGSSPALRRRQVRSQ